MFGKKLFRATAVVSALAAVAATGSLVTSGAAGADTTEHRPPLGTRADVPWGEVGPGWTVATWSARTGSHTVLFLVDPNGGRYTIKAGLPAYSYPQLFSATGDAAVVGQGDSSEQIDLRTGRTHAIVLRGGEVVGYAGRDDPDLLVADEGSGTTRHLVRTDGSGKPVATYPSSVPGAGTIYGTSVLGNAAGTRLVAGASHGLVLFDGKGAVVRRLHPVATSCYASSWWTKDVALADCDGTLWAVPTSGAHATRLSAGKSSTATRLGYYDMWRTSAGRIGLAESGCGPRALVRFGASGVGTAARVADPDGRPGADSVVGHAADSVAMIHTDVSGCVDGRRTLFGWNAKSGQETVFLGAPATSGTAVGALGYPTS